MNILPSRARSTATARTLRFFPYALLLTALGELGPPDPG